MAGSREQSSDGSEGHTVEMDVSQLGVDQFEDVEFGGGPQPARPPNHQPLSPTARPKVKLGLLDKMRSTIAQHHHYPARGPFDTVGQTESLLGEHAQPSHSHVELLPAARASSMPSGAAFSRQQSYNVTQSPGFIDFTLNSQTKPAPARNVFSLSATSASLSPAQCAPIAEGPAAEALPVSGLPGGEEFGTEQDRQRHRFQQLAGRLQDLAMQRIFLLLLVALGGVVLALFFAALYFTAAHSRDRRGCSTTIAARSAVASGSKVLLQGLLDPAVTVCLGEGDEGPWVSEDTFQALLAAHSDVYSGSHVSFIFYLPDDTSRWAIQLELGSLKFDSNASVAQLQVKDWYAPPRTTYPGSDEFQNVYGNNVELGSPLLVFKLHAEEDEIMGFNDDRR